MTREEIAREDRASFLSYYDALSDNSRWEVIALTLRLFCEDYAKGLTTLNKKEANA